LRLPLNKPHLFSLALEGFNSVGYTNSVQMNYAPPPPCSLSWPRIYKWVQK
jgi:hypothetical protein